MKTNTALTSKEASNMEVNIMSVQQIILLMMLIPGIILLCRIVYDLIKKKKWVLLFFIWLALFISIASLMPLNNKIDSQPLYPLNAFDPSTAKLVTDPAVLKQLNTENSTQTKN